MTDEIRDLQRTLDRDPADRQAFDALANIYAAAADWRRLRGHFEAFAQAHDSQQHFEQLARKLRDLADAEQDNQEKAAILVALGDVLFERGDNHDEGMNAYQAAFKAYPKDTTSLDRARRIYRELGHFKRVLLIYELEQKATQDDAHRADVWVHMAQVHGDYLGDRDAALDTLRQAIELDPDHRMAAAIEAIYESGGTVESAVDDIVREAHDAAVGGDDALAATRMMDAARLERVREGGGLESAADMAHQSQTFDPDNDVAHEFLASANGQLAHDDESGAVSDADDAPGPDRADGAGLTDKPTDLAADGGQSAAAEGSIEALGLESARARLADDPADLAALGVVTDSLRKEGAVDRLVDQLEDSVNHLRNKDGELEVMVDLATTLWEQLGDLERAEYYFKRIKLADATRPEMLAFYQDFYRRNDQWRKLFSLLSGRRDTISEPDDAIELAGQMARIAEVHMDSPDKAIDVWKNFLRHRDPVGAGLREAQTQLRRLYEQNNKWNALVDFLKHRVRQLAEDGPETAQARVILLERVADLYRDELGLDVMVINTLTSILELEPDHQSAFDELRNKLSEGRRWNDLADLLGARAELEVDRDRPAQAVEMLVEIADIWQDELHNVTQALPHLERVLTIDPDHAVVSGRLRDIYEQRRDYESLFELGYSQAGRLDELDRRQRLQELLELAEDRLRDPDRSIRVLEDLRELRPDDDELIEKLEFIHRRRDDHSRLADVLEAKARRAEADVRREILREAATLRETQLDDPTGAAKLWARIVDDTAGDDTGADDRAVDERAVDEQALAHLSAIYVHAERFDALRQVYGDLDAFDQLCDLLADAADAADAADEPDRARRLLRQLADVAVDELDDRRRAVASLEAVAELADDPRPIARQLDTHYDALGDIAGRVRARRILLAHAQDDDQRFDQLVELGGLEAQRDCPADAVEWLVQAVALRPDAAEVVDRAEKAARQCQSTGLLAEHLELIAGEVDDQTLRASYWRRLGRVLRDDQQNFEAATDYFERLRAHDPEDLDVLEALDALYERIDAPEPRIEVLRDTVDILSARGADRLDLVDYLTKIADVQRSHLDQVNAARETYNEILDLDPDHIAALRGIRQLHRDEHQWDDVVDSIHRELGLLGLDEVDRRVAAQMELADILRLQLQDLPEAIHWYGQVLADAPQHAQAVAAVEALLGESQLARQAALMLEPIFRDTDRPAQLAAALEARLAVSEDRFEQAEVLDELIPLYSDRLDDAAQAFEHACRQFKLDPGREEVWLRVEQLGAGLDRWADIEQVFAKHAPDADDLSAGRVNLLRHLASIREHQLNKLDEALATWETLHNVEPNDLSVVEALERLNRQLGYQAQLVDALEAKEGLLDNDEARIAANVEIADLADEVLDDPARSIEAYRAVLVLEADHQHGVDRLRQLYRRREQWDELAELLADQAQMAADRDRRGQLLVELGILRATRLGDYVGAMDLLGQLITEDPDDDDVLEATESLMETLAQLGDYDHVRLDLARTLEPVYRSRDDFQALIDVLEIRQDHTHDPFEKVAILDEITELTIERVGDQQEGYDALKRAVVVDPQDQDRRVRLVAVARSLDCLDDAAQALEDAAVGADAAAAGSVYRQLGALYEDHLQQPADAIAAYEAAVLADQRDIQALVALERIYQNTGQFDELAHNLRQQVAVGPAERRVDLLERASTLFEEVLDRPEDAIDTYVDLLDEQPGYTAALAGLERLYGQLERWMDMADILRRRAAGADDAAGQIDALERLAEVYADQLDDPHEAVAVHREILAMDADRWASLDVLDAIFSRDGQAQDLAEILAEKLRLTASEEVEARNRLELRLAGVLVDQLFEVDQGVSLYHSVLDRTAGQPEAIDALEALVADDTYAADVTDELVAHYESVEAFDKLVDLYQTRLDQSFEPAQKAQFLERIARIRHDHLDAAADAIDALGRAWELQPGRDELRQRLLSWAGPAEQWQRLADIYQDVLAVSTEPERIGELRLALADVYVDHVGDEAQAEVQFREVLGIDGASETAYGALETMLTAQKRWVDLVELLERKVNAVVGHDLGQARDILGRIAVTHEEQLSDGFSAAETYRRILELEPSDQPASSALSRLYRDQERWQDLGDHLDRCVEMAPSPAEAISMKQEWADLRRQQLMEPAAALELYRDILGFKSDHQPAIDALEAMFDGESPLRADVAESLEPIYRRQERYAKLLDVLLARADAAKSPQQARVLWQEGAQLAQEHLDDRRAAIDILGRVFESSPSDSNVRRQLHRLYGAAGQWEAMVERYDDLFEHHFGLDDELHAELLAEQAAVYEERLGQLDDAWRTYADVLTYAPADMVAVDGVERILARSQRWVDLAEFYRDRADAADGPDTCRVWLERLATLHEEVLGELDDAIAVYQQLDDLQSDDQAVQRTLARLFSHAHRWHDLAELYRRRIGQTYDPDEAMELRFQLAGLLEGDLGLVEDALQIYRDILADAAGHQDTLRALEGLRRDLANRDERWNHDRRQIIDLLLDHYNEQSHWRRIAELLEEKQRLVDDVDGRVDALSEMAEVIERGADDDADRIRGLMKLAHAFCVEPHNDKLGERVQQRAEQLGAWQRVIPIFLKGLESSADPRDQSALLNAIGQAYAGPLSDPESAIAAYQQAVEITGDQQALGRLQHLYGELELWQPLVDVLERRLDDVYDTEARQSLLRRIATIYDEILDEPAAATDAYEALRDQQPSERSLLAALARLYDRQGRWVDLEDVLRVKAEVHADNNGADADDTQRAATLGRLAEVQQTHLDAPADAIASYQAVVAIDDDNLDAVRALSGLFARTERWAELLQNLDVERDFSAGVDQLDDIESRMAAVLVEHLGAADEALEHLQRVIGRTPDHGRAVELLDELVGRPDTGDDAAGILQDLYRSQHQWEGLEELLERRIDQLDEPQRRAEAFMELAQLHEEQFDAPRLAFGTLGRGFRALPGVDFLGHELQRMSRRLDNADELAAVYEDTLDAGGLEPDVELDLRRHTGQIYADALDAPSKAIDHFEAALRVDEFDRQALDWLDQLYQRLDRWDDLSVVLETRLSTAEVDEINDVRFRLGYLHEMMFEDHYRAIDLYRQIIAEEPDHGGAIEGLRRMVEDVEIRREICELLEPVYRQSESFEQLTELLELKLEVADSAAERADLYRRMAAVELDQLGRVHLGYAHLGRALRQDPHDIDVQRRLEALAEDHDMYDQLVALYEDVVETLDDPVRIVDLASAAAGWAFEKLDEPQWAADLYQRVLELEADNRRAIDALESIARRQDSPQALEAALGRKADVLFDPDVRHDVLLELGDVRMRLELFDQAIAAYREVLTLDESDVDVIRQLVALLEITERYDALVDMLERLAALVEDPDERRQLYLQMGQYTRRYIDAPERSIEAYRRADELEPDTAGVLEALQALYETTEQWGHLVDIVDRQLTRLEVAEPDQSEPGDIGQHRLGLLVKRAQINYEQFDQIDEAIDDYQRAFAIQKDSASVVDALDQLYRAEARWEDLAELYRQQVELVDEQQRLIELHVDMADIHQAHLDDDETAFELLGEVLDIQPDSRRALQVLQSMYERRQEWAHVVDTLARRSDAAPAADTVDLLVERANILETRLDNLDAAAAIYAQVLEVDSDHAKASAKLKELYAAIGAHEKLYNLYDRQAAAADDDQRVELYAQMAELANADLPDQPGLRIGALEQAYALRDDDLDIAEPLLEAYIDNDDFDRAEPMLDEVIDTLQADRRMRDVVRFQHLRGKLAEQKGALDDAQASYEAAHKIDATYIPNLMSLGKLLVRTDQWEAALKIFQTLLLHKMSIDDAATKVDLYYYFGRVRLQRGNPGRAKDMFSRALSIDADHEPTQQAMAEL